LPAEVADFDALLAANKVETMLVNHERRPATLVKGIVATEVDGIPELLEHGKAGILVPVREPATLSEVLCSLVENSATLREWKRGVN